MGGTPFSLICLTAPRNHQWFQLADGSGIVIAYRMLDLVDTWRMGDIDRSERIDGVYTASAGALTLHERHIDVQGWYPSEIPDHVSGFERSFASGGAAFGAFDGDRLVGIIGLRTTPVGGDPTVMQLEPLHISAPYRNQGLGKHLVTLIAERARSLGATALYISAIPTRNTVEAYIRMGAHVLAEPDPVLLAKEPEDIHLLLPLT